LADKHNICTRARTKPKQKIQEQDCNDGEKNTKIDEEGGGIRITRKKYISREIFNKFNINRAFQFLLSTYEIWKVLVSLAKKNFFFYC
jgi:hypothetical protein